MHAIHIDWMELSIGSTGDSDGEEWETSDMVAARKRWYEKGIQQVRGELEELRSFYIRTLENGFGGFPSPGQSGEVLHPVPGKRVTSGALVQDNEEKSDREL